MSVMSQTSIHASDFGLESHFFASSIPQTFTVNTDIYANAHETHYVSLPSTVFHHLKQYLEINFFVCTLCQCVTMNQLKCHSLIIRTGILRFHMCFCVCAKQIMATYFILLISGRLIWITVLLEVKNQMDY